MRIGYYLGHLQTGVTLLGWTPWRMWSFECILPAKEEEKYGHIKDIPSLNLVKRRKKMDDSEDDVYVRKYLHWWW